MTGMISSQGGLTRRSFLKGTAVAAGAVGIAGAGSMISADGWLAPVKAQAAPEERTAYTYHQKHCGGCCALKCTVRDGRLVLVQPNDVGEDMYRTICLKGISEVTHIYGDGRVQTPLKRVGERGSGQFEPISWDEALDDIAERVKEIQAQYGKDALLVASCAEADSMFLGPLLGAQSGGFTGIDVGVGNGLDPATGLGGGYAMSAPEARDWARSKLVLSVGTNYCESSLPSAYLFVEAKEAGAHMVTVDPHYSTTASKSDEWIPIAPGADAALFLGMVSHILDHKLYDDAFVRQHTSFPFLVDDATHKLMRDHAEDPTAEEPETGTANPFFVMDPVTGNPIRFDQSATPALSVTEVPGAAGAHTVWDLMLETQKPYTTAWAAEVTGIPQERIEALAEEYAEGPSSLALGWGGNDKMTNADISGHAAALLVALTGNIGKPGAGVGVYVGPEYNSWLPALGAWPVPETWAAADSEVSLYDMPVKENNCHGAIFWGDFIAQHVADMNLTTQWADTLDLIVSIDPYFTEGAKWSDYILPATSRFEYDDEIGNIADGYSQLVLQEKVIEPLFEAKTDLWITREIAKRFGQDVYLPKTGAERVEALLATSADPQVAALELDDIVANQGVWPSPDRSEIRTVADDLKFATPSERLEVYYDNMVPFNQALPQWEPCEEIDNEELRATYPLQLTNTRTRFRIHNQYNDAKWLQLYYEPTVVANPSDLEARGIANGDIVEVFNERGSFTVPCDANDAIRPGSVRIYEAGTADYTVAGNVQDTTNRTTIERGYSLMCGPVIPFSDTLVDIRKA